MSHIFQKLTSVFRERRDNYVPEVSALSDSNLLDVDPATSAMVKALEVENKEALVDALKCTEARA